MFSTRIPPYLLKARLNSEAYAPEHTASEERIRVSGLCVLTLADIVDKPINNSIRNVAAELDAPGASVPMFRPADMSEGWLSVHSAPKLRAGFERIHSKARLYPGDIALGIAGTVGEVGRVPSSIPYGNINGSCARIAPRDSYKGYVHGFLRSKYGQSSLIRWAVGAVQKHLNLEDLPEILIAAPVEEQARLYIGNKVRQAEALRRKSHNLVAAGLDRVQSLFPWVAGGEAAVRSSRVKAPELHQRLNADVYSPEYLEDERQLDSAGMERVELQSLVDGPINNSIRNVSAALSSDRASVPMFRPADIDGLWLNRCTTPLLPADFESMHKKSRVGHGDIVLGIAGSVGVAGRVPPLTSYGNINGSSARLQVRPSHRGYLLLLLNSGLGRRLLIRWAVGAVQKHLNLEDLPGIRIPVPADRKLLEDLNRKVDVAEAARLASRALTTAARLLVEALIERKVSEADLVAAHKSPEADRALLERLTADGIDAPDADPLFPDLDRLEELLSGTP